MLNNINGHMKKMWMVNKTVLCPQVRLQCHQDMDDLWGFSIKVILFKVTEV